MLQDGQTAVIGGLINQSRSNNQSKIPFLGDIPVLGWLFKNKQVNSTINNLYIFITVRIIRNEDEMKTLFAEYDVPGAHVKPFKLGMVLAPLGDDSETPSKAAPSPTMLSGKAGRKARRALKSSKSRSSPPSCRRSRGGHPAAPLLFAWNTPLGDLLRHIAPRGTLLPMANLRRVRAA
jgi:hypothetical protein